MTFTHNIRYDQQRITSVDSNLIYRSFIRPNVIVVVLAVFQRSGLQFPHLSFICPVLPWRPGVFIGTLSGPQAKA
jgi:hypothetical protein